MHDKMLVRNSKHFFLCCYLVSKRYLKKNIKNLEKMIKEKEKHNAYTIMFNYRNKFNMKNLYQI